VPNPRQAGKRKLPWIDGEHRVNLAKRAGQKRGWPTEMFDLYGEKQVKRYKTFLAIRRPAGGVIRMVLVTSRRAGEPMTRRQPLPRS
jgi:hypothetical protein